jgi:hypothetical protein
MDHTTMMGMFIGGVVMSAPPVLLGIGIAVYVLRRRAVAAPGRDRVQAEREGAES